MDVESGILRKTKNARESGWTRPCNKMEDLHDNKKCTVKDVSTEIENCF